MKRSEDTRAISLRGTCPVCQARAGSPCTTPTDRSRKEVTWFHFGRYDAGLTRLQEETARGESTETGTEKP